MYPSSIQRLIEIFSKFPTVGPRTASRFVFYLISQPEEEIEKIIQAIQNVRQRIKLCDFCFNPFDVSEKPVKNELSPASDNLCPICRDNSRNKKLLCVVEKETDLASIENIKEYKGLYFILGGTVSNLRKESIEKLRINELTERIQNPFIHGVSSPGFEEIIIATNSTSDGETTALYLERILKPLNKKITRLGRGLPVGGELEYADEETLKSAFEGRK